MSLAVNHSVLLIGAAGNRGQLYMQTVGQKKNLQLDSIVINKAVPDLSEFSPPPEVFTNLQEALKKKNFDVAIVSVPHHLHYRITRTLVDARVKIIIKEKPLALTSKEADELKRCLEESKIRVMTITQRSVLPTFEHGLRVLPRIGKLKSFEYKYHFALKEMTSGWRAQKEFAHGGVILDMGYHAIEILTLYFGTPESVKGSFSYKYKEMSSEKLEDSAQIKFNYNKINGVLSLNRHAAKNEELFRIEGEEGRLEINREELVHYGFTGSEVERLKCPLTKEEQIHALFERFLEPHYKDWQDQAFERHILTTKIIERIQQSSEEVIFSEN